MPRDASNFAWSVERLPQAVETLALASGLGRSPPGARWRCARGRRARGRGGIESGRGRRVEVSGRRQHENVERPETAGRRCSSEKAMPIDSSSSSTPRPLSDARRDGRRDGCRATLRPGSPSSRTAIDADVEHCRGLAGPRARWQRRRGAAVDHLVRFRPAMLERLPIPRRRCGSTCATAPAASLVVLCCVRRRGRCVARRRALIGSGRARRRRSRYAVEWRFISSARHAGAVAWGQRACSGSLSGLLKIR